MYIKNIYVYMYIIYWIIYDQVSVSSYVFAPSQRGATYGKLEQIYCTRVGYMLAWDLEAT